MDGLRVGRFTIPESELEESFTTSGGPGGQHANRSHTAVELRFDVASTTAIPEPQRTRIVERLGSTVTVIAADSRSQWRNRSVARRRMVERLEEAMRPERVRRPTRPTRASRRRRLEEKRKRGETKRLRRPPEW